MLFRESHFENPQIPFPKKLEKSEKKELDSEKGVSLSEVINKVTSQEMPQNIESLLERKPLVPPAEKSKEIKEKESQVIGGKESYSDFEKTRSTFRGIEEVCRVLGLQKEKFKNKTVLDIGSGLGGLALDLASLPELNTQIISIDPRYTKEYFQKSLTIFNTKCEKAGIKPPKTMEELVKLKEKFNVTEPVTLLDATSELQKRGQPMVAGTAEALPFKDKSLDLVLSSYAIPTIMEDKPEQIQKAIQEIGRTLKIRGKAYLGPISNELKSLIEDFPSTSNIRREFHGLKKTEEEAAKYGMDARWVLVLRKLKIEHSRTLK